jgi:2'-5' RNA ligase
MTALLVAAPEAEVIYQYWHGDRSRLGVPGLPLHITILFPFMPVPTIDSRVEDDLDELARSHLPFEYRLSHVDRFPGVLYLAPSPTTRFIRLTQAVSAKWPGYPPYEGRYAEIVPHVTLASGDDPDGLVAAVESTLPIRALARELLLMAPDEDGIWLERRRFPRGESLAGGARVDA